MVMGDVDEWSGSFSSEKGSDDLTDSAESEGKNLSIFGECFGMLSCGRWSRENPHGVPLSPPPDGPMTRYEYKLFGVLKALHAFIYDQIDVIIAR